MKKIFVLLGMIVILLSQCSENDEMVFDNEISSGFSKQADEYGKLVASHIREIVREAYNSEEIEFITSREQINQLVRTVGEKLPIHELSRSSKLPFDHMTKEQIVEMAQKVKSLSNEQLEVIEMISNAKRESNSAGEFSQKLLDIKEYIKENVLEIEQERLLMVVSALYFSLKEVEALVSEGYLPGEYSRSSQVNMMTRSGEAGDVTGPTPGNIATWCKEGLSTVWLVAVAEPSPVGELIATGATLIVGGYLLYQYMVHCYVSPGYTVEECLELYIKCMNLPGEYEGGRCYDCYRYCEAQKVWNC